MDTLRRVALLVEYDGTEFSGSQLQPGRRTVQGAIEDAVYAYDAEPDAEPRRAALAGRTDAGVHARGQVAAIDLNRHDDLATVRDAINHYLPDDVAVRAAADVDESFDPRRCATSRCYRYRIEDGRPRSPLSRRDRWQVRKHLDDGAMAEAAGLLPREERDWSAFASPLEDGRSPLRTLHHLSVVRTGAHTIEITMEADAFLPHQVRRTAGALESVGAGASTPEAFASLVDGEVATVGPTAPPQGLTLEAVRYAPGVPAWDCDDAAPGGAGGPR